MIKRLFFAAIIVPGFISFLYFSHTISNTSLRKSMKIKRIERLESSELSKFCFFDRNNQLVIPRKVRTKFDRPLTRLALTKCNENSSLHTFSPIQLLYESGDSELMESNYFSGYCLPIKNRTLFQNSLVPCSELNNKNPDKSFE